LIGADLAEQFQVTGDRPAEPGSVMILAGIDSIAVSNTPYVHRVAGIVSEAGNYRPGIILDRQSAESRSPLALSGRVWCLVDADEEAGALGDLLTTSATPGHAMRTTDRARAFGAVIGKALRKPLVRARSGSRLHSTAVVSDHDDQTPLSPWATASDVREGAEGCHQARRPERPTASQQSPHRDALQPPRRTIRPNGEHISAYLFTRPSSRRIYSTQPCRRPIARVAISMRNGRRRSRSRSSMRSSLRLPER
jgi:hypothetical protein